MSYHMTEGASELRTSCDWSSGEMLPLGPNKERVCVCVCEKPELCNKLKLCVHV